MLQIAGHEPGSGGVGEREEWRVVRIRQRMWPRRGIGQLQARLNQMFQPARRESVAHELGPPKHFAILLEYRWACHQLHFAGEYPIHDQAMGWAHCIQSS